MNRLIAALMLAGWVGAIAILSVQNATLVSLRFLGLQSVQIPIGVVLAFSVALGMVGAALVPLIWSVIGSRATAPQQQRDRRPPSPSRSRNQPRPSIGNWLRSPRRSASAHDQTVWQASPPPSTSSANRGDDWQDEFRDDW